MRTPPNHQAIQVYAADYGFDLALARLSFCGRVRMSKARTNQIIVAALFALGLSSCSHFPDTVDIDLVASSVRPIPNPVYVGDKVMFNFVVSNAGPHSVKGGTYDVELFLGTNLISFDYDTSDILAGGSVPYSMADGYFNWQPTNTGRYHYRLVVGRTTLKERTKTNNVLEGQIDVRP